MGEGASSPEGIEIKPIYQESRGDILSGKETVQKPHCLFISGAMATNAGIADIKAGLENEYGAGKVDVFNSILSSDPQNPKRFEQMADVIQKQAREGLDIVVHSLGAAELSRVIKKIAQKDETFFDKRGNTEKLNIVLISPSGFNKGIVGALRYLGRTFRFNREQGSWPVFSKSATLRRGIDALTAFPPDGITPENLSKALREAMPEISQDREEIEKITSEKGENYVPYLSDGQKEQVATYSNMIRLAIDNRNYGGLRHLVSQYGKIFKGALDEVYSGNFASEKMQEETNEVVKSTIGGWIELLKIINNSLGSVPMKELEALQEKGVNVRFIVPEYDTYLRIEQAMAFLEGLDIRSQNIKIAAGGTHQFLSLQGSQSGESIKSSLGNQTS